MASSVLALCRPWDPTAVDVSKVLPSTIFAKTESSSKSEPSAKQAPESSAQSAKPETSAAQTKASSSEAQPFNESIVSELWPEILLSADYYEQVEGMETQEVREQVEVMETQEVIEHVEVK